MSLPTPHIETLRKEEFAKTVIMPGDPLRAKYIADNYLENVTRVNAVRNMFGYTGTYKGKKVSVMGSGMGMASMGIYAYELFKYYDVDNIIRIGSAGSYKEELKVYDVVLVEESYCESDFVEIVTGDKARDVKSSEELNNDLEESAKRQNIELKKAKAHCTDVFYRKNSDDYKKIIKKYGCDLVEMETAALFATANELGKNASAVVTISDSFITGESTTAQQREQSFTNMMEVALGTITEK
ncbi:purine-nucleoside phosphorylase [Francisella orientalis]|uniref:Uridine phosphorylase n=1 Tax=Francisella orientalis TaxID=299583 RepID=A0AAP6XAQ3_9GAMM|nr:purine-nucleoside phosphorylase [Francisella orientalis]AFJ43677.1 purine-nucleoside phosphorylase [Francisella orientalis str. Toba 04]AHB98236.1 purine nucleoside phosphorylase [Francisella orientalis LADL 07-285A]AKN85379.1 Purine-nucleoside phosphorylase [Francisella orientalis FNO12]AKN86918.1 Purine-nucleoside phosphorylase [Francisella orientalis FNO24]AKN88456.1 Purine-nucleoside phosphorylase [Francisella orientalis]